MADVSLRVLLFGEDKTASKAISGVGSATDETTKKMGKWGAAGAVMKGALAAGVIQEAAGAVIEFGKESVTAYRDAAASQRQLEDAYKRFPALQDVSITKLREQAKAIQDKTGADADDIAKGQAKLAQFKLTGSQISALTPLMVDYAAKTGKDMPAASDALGKAMMGNGRAMKQLGIDFKDTGDPAKNLELIMAGLQEKTGGFAESEASTLDGKLGILSTKFGDLQESVGEKLLPILTNLADVGMQVVDWISQNASWLGPMAAGIGAVAAAAGIYTAAQWLLNAALAANPISLIVIAIAALIGGLVAAYNNVGWFRDGVNAAFTAIGDIARWLWNNALAPTIRAVLNGFAWVVDGLAGMLDALGGVPGFEWAKDAANGLRGMSDSAKGAADSIKDIPDAEPKVELEDQATEEVKKIDKQIAKLKDKRIKAEAKGDTKEVENLDAAIAKLKDKKTKVEADVQGKSGVDGLKTSIDAVTGKTVTAKANVSGGTETDGLKGKIDALTGKTVNAGATTSGKGAVGELDEAIEGVKSKSVTVEAHVKKTGPNKIKVSPIPGVHSAVQIMAAYAQGGLTKAGLALVGEEGPELVQMPAGAYVHTASKTAALARSLEGAAMGAGGGTTIINQYSLTASGLLSESEAGLKLEALLNKVNRNRGGQGFRA